MVRLIHLNAFDLYPFDVLDILVVDKSDNSNSETTQYLGHLIMSDSIQTMLIGDALDELVVQARSYPNYGAIGSVEFNARDEPFDGTELSVLYRYWCLELRDVANRLHCNIWCKVDLTRRTIVGTVYLLFQKGHWRPGY